MPAHIKSALTATQLGAYCIIVPGTSYCIMASMAVDDVGEDMTVLSSGMLYAWGAGHTGVLGAGPAEDCATPQPVPELPLVTSVAAGDSSAYAIDEEGRVWSWGWDAFCHMLGRGQVEYPPAMAPSALRAMGLDVTDPMEGDGGVGEPAVVEGLENIVQLAVGEDNVYALSLEGEVWAWGSAAGLGGRAQKDASRPKKIEALSGITSIVASPSGVFGFALDGDGQVWSWGRGWDGELGHGKPRADPTAQPVPGLAEVRSIQAGNGYGMAVQEDNTVVFWGLGESYDLLVRNTYRVKEPINFKALAGMEAVFVGPFSCISRNGAGETFGLGRGLWELLRVEPEDGSPLRLEMLDGTGQLAISSDHGFAWRPGQALIGFGEATLGALGNGDFTEQKYYAPAPVEGMGSVRIAIAGNNFSLAIVT